MRSRPELTVFVSPTKPLPGDLVEVEARLESHSDTPLDRVVFDLEGVETLRIQSGKSQIVRRHSHLHLRAEAPATPLTLGTHTYRAQFQLPPGLPAHYHGRRAFIEYTLEVRADIPWWPDRVGRYSITVRPLPGKKVAPTPGVFVTQRGGPRAGELFVELSLASTTCEPGGELAGTVAFTNAAKVRRPTVALVASERLFSDAGFLEGGSIRMSSEVQRWELPLSEGAPEEAVGQPFCLQVEPTMVAGYVGAISALDWAVEITTQALFSRRTLLRVPIQVLPRTGAAPATPVAVRAVGRERHAQIFARVGPLLGLEVDAEHDELRGAFGAVTLRLAMETRPDGTLTTAAHLAWPPLGACLSVGPRTWTDLLSSRGAETGDVDFDHRFHAQSRFPEQARAILDADVRALLLGFPLVAVSDDGATLAIPGLLEDAPLAKFAERAARAGRALDAAFARVPLPPLLAGGDDAWRALAARLGGRFEPGSGAIRDGTLGLERVEIATEWTDDGELRATVVRVPLDTRIDLETLSPAARAQAAPIEQGAGGRVAIAEDAITLTLDRALPDPRMLDAALEALSRLAHAVRHREGASPFRS